MAEPLIPIIQKAFDFNVALYGYVNKFPRAHKALLGRELLRLALELVVLLAIANHRVNKVPGLQESSAKLDALRITLRLAKQLAFLWKIACGRSSESWRPSGMSGVSIGPFGSTIPRSGSSRRLRFVIASCIMPCTTSWNLSGSTLTFATTTPA